MGYFGSKATSGLCQPIIAMMPPHDIYIETHLGGGAIMRRKPAALRNIGIDRDARALDGFECDYPVELIHGCAHRFLSEYAFEGSELIYSDPPYLRRTRTSKHRYRYDYEEADHVELLELLKGVPLITWASSYRISRFIPDRPRVDFSHCLLIVGEPARTRAPMPRRSWWSWRRWFAPPRPSFTNGRGGRWRSPERQGIQNAASSTKSSSWR